jgi:hypothetical protein
MSSNISDDSLFILNEKNVLITKKFINNIFKSYNIDFKITNLKLYQIAMTHISYCKNNDKKVKDGVITT